MSVYISTEELKYTLELTGESFADADIDKAVASASRTIDKLCGQRFYTTSVDETRYFEIEYSGVGANAAHPFTSTGYTSGTGSDRIRVGALQSVTSLTSDPNGDGSFADHWTATDYVLDPRNATLDGIPYRWVIRHPRGQFYFPVGYPGAVKIVGKFGWTTPPAEIVAATSMVASRLLRRMREAPFGVVSVGVDVGAVARISNVDPDVRTLLQPYMDAPFA
jgi:hypothetical protein